MDATGQRTERRGSASVSDDNYHFLVRPDELPSGKSRCFEVAGHPVLLCHTRDGFFAVHNICTHAYARLDEGRLRGNRVICPLHGASFDVRDGAVKGQPAHESLRSYPLRVTDDAVEVLIED